MVKKVIRFVLMVLGGVIGSLSLRVGCHAALELAYACNLWAPRYRFLEGVGVGHSRSYPFQSGAS